MRKTLDPGQFWRTRSLTEGEGDRNLSCSLVSETEKLEGVGGVDEYTKHNATVESYNVQGLPLPV